jgi:hypothetical protein
MTVEELIKELEKFPKDVQVRFWSGLEPGHELGTIDLFVEENIVYINDAKCLGEDDYFILDYDTEG